MNATLNLRSIVFFIIMGMIMMQGAKRWGVEGCPLYCLDVAYMTCPSSGSQQLEGSCNCCMAPQGCTLHLSDGSSLDC
ncbi:unnamed protein product [Amaranthus hypochondriacus]